ncbi:TonB-dependent receptor plug domain-containing protein [Sphingomonas sp. 35-24ZXX]|uniref:TonB-dependent receptor plug domain-containing protein n=1 Tax=Sphingomonas sp. 35-24ZXX TaxID=1545915 RepID=UPI00068F0A23|nr:TonB-dependent receptor [Sphingomonas sp. 35-24ZXX]
MPNPFLKVTISASALCASLPAAAMAQDMLAEASQREPVIVVTANRTAQPIERVGQSITVIDSAEIERRQTQAVADILRTVPGVSIARNGGIGTSTSVFIRGAESDQTVALVDGIKLNDPSSPGGGFNFGNLLIGNIERIEVLRGPSSVLWGSQAIGGVINMITRQPTDDLNVNLRGEYGYRDTGQLVGNVAGKAGPLTASVGAGYFRTDGISAFSEARGGVEKDGYENYGANGNVNLAVSDWLSVDARGWYSEGRVNIDGFPPPNFAFGDVNEESRTREIVGYTGINAALFDGRFRNRLGYAYTDTRRRSIALDGPATETFAGHGRNERIEYQGIFDIADGWQLTGGLERETSRFSSSSFGAVPSVGRARIDSVYAQIVASPVAGLTLTGGVRHDDHNRFGGATTLGASGVYAISQTGTTLRASYAEGFKAPSLFQLQSDFGNQLLQPERSKGWDAGFTQDLVEGRLQASATFFRRTSDDLIIFISCPLPRTGICAGRPSGTYDNVSKARAEGVEIGLMMQPVDALRLQANYTYTDATNRSPGNANFGRQLVRRPQHSVTALVDYRWGFGLETGITLTHVGANFDNANNSRKVEGYVLADLRASFPLTERVEIYGRVENLFDEQYETVFRYGSPGRAGYVGVRLTY